MTIKEIHRKLVTQWHRHKSSEIYLRQKGECETFEAGFEWGCIHELELALEMLEGLPEIEPKDRVITA